jgi:hypothetical protein
MRRAFAWLIFPGVALSCGGVIGGDPTPGDGGTSFNSVNVSSHWSAGTLRKMFDDAPFALNGVTFDGRYAYFAPQDGGVVFRFDTTKQLDDSGAWDRFDTHVAESPEGVSFAGAAFDGRYVYLAPYATTIFRYDTRAPFSAAASWTTFDTSALGAHTFAGVVFDGRYLVFIPLGTSDVFVRYDTQSAFEAVASWERHAETNAKSDFAQAAFDGRFIYTNGGVILRYDTRAPFDASSSWSSFDPTTVHAGTHAIRGVVFDGQRVWFGAGDDAVALQYDSSGTFADPASWTTLDLRSLVPSTWELVGIGPASFDGRNVYFTAETRHDAPATTTDAFVIQCDTTNAFTCTAIDGATLGGSADWLYTSLFDGRYVYFASDDDSYIARFDAKSPPSMPTLPAFHGSFF